MKSGEGVMALEQRINIDLSAFFFGLGIHTCANGHAYYHTYGNPHAQKGKIAQVYAKGGAQGNTELSHTKEHFHVLVVILGNPVEFFLEYAKYFGLTLVNFLAVAGVCMAKLICFFNNRV